MALVRTPGGLSLDKIDGVSCLDILGVRVNSSHGPLSVTTRCDGNLHLNDLGDIWNESKSGRAGFDREAVFLCNGALGSRGGVPDVSAGRVAGFHCATYDYKSFGNLGFGSEERAVGLRSRTHIKS
jgi:hypothetical protein